MRTGQQDRIDIRTLFPQKVQILFHKIIGTRSVVLVIFNQGDPQWASLLKNLDLRKKFRDFDRIRLGEDSAPGRQYTYVTGAAIVAYHFGSGPDHPQYPVIWRNGRQ